MKPSVTAVTLLAGLTKVILNYGNSLVFVSRLFRKSSVSHEVARAGGRGPDGGDVRC